MGTREPGTKVRAARQEFLRLHRETPDEARDEQGWTPELVAAAQRHLDALGEWLAWLKARF
jgi:hypothetical protein